jgi:SAM-dependent methyltransferase
MNAFIPPIVHKIKGKLGKITIYKQYQRYISGIRTDHPLAGLPTRLVGNASADPKELLSHYDAYGFWTAKKIAEKAAAHPAGQRLQILDVGSPKMMNCVLSANHDITSVVLADCGDRLSGVKYQTHDVADKLPFSDQVFDVFTSSVAMPLFGLGRYGDKLDPNCLVNLIAELTRVMKPDGKIVVSLSLGPNVLNFNNSWFFDLPTIKRLFFGWEIVDHLVDHRSSPRAAPIDPGRRFSKNTSIGGMSIGDFRVIFLELQRQQTVSD